MGAGYVVFSEACFALAYNARGDGAGVRTTQQPTSQPRNGFKAPYLGFAKNWKQSGFKYHQCYEKVEYLIAEIDIRTSDCREGYTNQCCDSMWWCVGDYLYDYIDCRHYGTQADGSPLVAYCCPELSYQAPGFHEVYKPVAVNAKESGFDYINCYTYPKFGEPCKEGFTNQCCDSQWWCVAMEYHPWARQLGYTNCSWYGVQMDRSPLLNFCCPPWREKKAEDAPSDSDDSSLGLPSELPMTDPEAEASEGQSEEGQVEEAVQSEEEEKRDCAPNSGTEEEEQEDFESASGKAKRNKVRPQPSGKGKVPKVRHQSAVEQEGSEDDQAVVQAVKDSDDDFVEVGEAPSSEEALARPYEPFDYLHAIGAASPRQRLVCVGSVVDLCLLALALVLIAWRKRAPLIAAPPLLG